ncbi:MAG: nitroreductase/quinone reductase family protein [Actinomycetota bacterium]
MGSQPLSLVRWTALCAVAEGIGMTAAAAAAKTSQALIGAPVNNREVLLALSIAVVGGLVEGVALGGLQAAGLGRLLPDLSRSRWVLVTTAVAGVGWAGASAAAGGSGQDDGATPSLLFILGMSAVLGAVMGALLGTIQATVLRDQVRHPWRWVAANMTAWVPAMAVIFFGATLPGADWPSGAVIPLATVTGLAAGGILGLISGWFLPGLDGGSAHNRIILSLLGTRAHPLLDRALVVLQVRGVVSGQTFELPVQYAADDNALVIVPGRPETKLWWRNLREPASVEVLVAGLWQPGYGILLLPGEPGYDDAIQTYLRRWPRTRIAAETPVVQVRFTALLIPAEARTPPTSPAAE